MLARRSTRVPVEGAPDPDAIVHPDHLVADDATPQVWPVRPSCTTYPIMTSSKPRVPGATPPTKALYRSRPNTGEVGQEVAVEEGRRNHERTDVHRNEHRHAVQESVEEIIPEAVAETGPAIGVVTPDIGTTLGAVSLLTLAWRRWRWRHVAHGSIVGHPPNGHPQPAPCSTTPVRRRGRSALRARQRRPREAGVGWRKVWDSNPW